MKIYFEDLANGWVNLRIQSGNKDILNDGVSYSPYDSFGDLIDTLHVLKTLNGLTDRKVMFHAEPCEYEFNFTKSNSNFELKVYEFPNSSRSIQPEILFEIEGDYKEVCLPFWRGLRSLQSELTPEALDNARHRQFPSKQLDLLTEVVKEE